LASPGDTINFDSSLAGGTITLNVSLGKLTIDKNLTIRNTNKNKIVISGSDTIQIFYVNNQKSLSLENLTLKDGLTAIDNYQGIVTVFRCWFDSNGHTNASGGALYNYKGTITVDRSRFSNNSGNNGGAIHNAEGFLTVTDSSFENNLGRSRGGAIYNSLGAIEVMHLVVNGSTFSGNSTTDYEGGAIYNDSYGPATITNSTFYNNSAGTKGGAIFSYNATDLEIKNSTFSANSATTVTAGAGVHSVGYLRIYNSIIANSTSGYDCYWNYTAPTWSIHNLVENNDPSHSCGTPLLTSDPMLGSLSDNGGYTYTMALPLSSPALDQGHADYCSSTDQRGITRPQGSACDIGAYEYEYPDTTPPVVLSSLTADSNPTSAATVNFTVTFSEPVAGVDAGDFWLRLTGVTGAVITTVSGSNTVYSVAATTGTGIGTIKLMVYDNDSIVDTALNPLGGVGIENGNYTTGEVNMVRYHSVFLPLILR
jgi:hypothetical protein